MAILKAKFIGLSDKDIGGAKELLKYRWFQKKDWQEEIKRMLASGLKYELDALANKEFRYRPRPTWRGSSKKKTGWISAWCGESPVHQEARLPPA